MVEESKNTIIDEDTFESKVTRRVVDGEEKTPPKATLVFKRVAESEVENE